MKPHVSKVQQYVTPAYRHHAKSTNTGAGLALNGAHMKWYEIATAEQPVSDHVRQLALAFLRTQASTQDWELKHELGFIVLHRCEADFYFLIVCTWRGSNELWQTVYAKDSAHNPGFSLFPRENQHKGTFCVWEMGPVWHETQAWTRFLTSLRDAAAVQAYLSD
jgi:hypothetical protein